MQNKCEEASSNKDYLAMFESQKAGYRRLLPRSQPTSSITRDRIQVTGVSELERVMIVVAIRKKDEEIKKRRKEEARSDAQESHGGDMIKKQKANMKRKGVGGGGGGGQTQSQGAIKNFGFLNGEHCKLGKISLKYNLHNNPHHVRDRCICS